jgi:putative transposase
MPRRPRLAAGDLAYHVLSRRVGRLPLFQKPADYAAFEQVLQEIYAQTRLRIAAYFLMPTHWHLILWPRQDGELSEALRCITVTHTQRWHAHHHPRAPGRSIKAVSNHFQFRPMNIFWRSCAMWSEMRCERSW